MLKELMFNVQVHLEDAMDEDSATIDFPEFLTLMSKVEIE